MSHGRPKMCFCFSTPFSRKRLRRVLARKMLSSKTVIKDCRSHSCLETLPSKTAEVPKWWLSSQAVIKDFRSDGCHEKVESKTVEVMAALKDCHQRPPTWWPSSKTVMKDCWSDGCFARLSSKTAEVMAAWKTPETTAESDGCLQRQQKRLLKDCVAVALKHLRSALRCWSLLTFIGQFWHNKSTVWAT